MTNAGVLATSISVLSLLVATSSFAWGISSWRRSGPLLRVHALLYDQVLVLRVFNAGRSPDRLEQLVIGGVRRGRGGIDITEALGGPVTLAPGEAYHRQINWREHVPSTRQAQFVQGWESLWLLRGSMTEQRCEVLSRPGRRVPRTGWELAEPGSERKRFVPLLMAIPLGILALDAIPHALPDWIFVLIVAAVLGRRVLKWVSSTDHPPVRTRIEHAVVVVGSIVFPIGCAARAEWSKLFVAYVVIAIGLAVPSAVSQTIETAGSVAEGARARLARLRRAHAQT